MRLKPMRRCHIERYDPHLDHYTVYVTDGRGSVGAALRRFDRIRKREKAAEGRQKGAS